MSKCIPRYLTCFVCAMWAPFSWISGVFPFLSVNVMWLHLLMFTFICLFCSQFFIFVMCFCSSVAAVSGFLCLTRMAVSSANVSILLLTVVGMPAIYSVYSIGPRTLPCGTPTLISLISEYASFIFTTKVLLFK